jgi:beta-glucanase (GH16 family)
VSSQSVLQTTSFIDDNGMLATVILNLTDREVAYRFCVGNEEADSRIPARAIQTLVHDRKAPSGWETDFFDDFDSFNPANWQDQMLWVNNEQQCYVPDGAYGTREVSNGSLKLKVVKVDQALPCSNQDKHGAAHPDTPYVAGRICSKNRQEFIKGKWTARLRMWGSGQPSMFPAWWILGAQNNEPPVDETDETVFWPLTGSGEIDIFEHHGDGGPGHFTTGAIKSLGEKDKGDWRSLRTNIDANLDVYHEYSVEWAGSDLVYRLDGKEVHRNEGEGDNYPEAMFAILNFAKITNSPMEGEWVMEVDWVKHESWNDRFDVPEPIEFVQAVLPTITVPARIEAEGYAAMQGIQTEACGDEGGTLNLGFFDPGDTVDFRISVETAGDFTIAYRLASEPGSEGFQVLIDNELVITQSLEATGGWQVYVTKSSPSFPLEAGVHTLRFLSVGSQWNINWFELQSQ